MIRGSAFQELGAVIDELEERELTVLDVVTAERSLAAGQRLSAEITVGLDALSGLSAVETASIVPCETDETDETDDPVTATFTVELPVDEASASQAPSDDAASHRASAADAVSDPPETDDDVPYYKDYERLARVYEEYDTFAEMTEALGVDVTPATVREHMVNHGIHPPSDASEASRDGDGSDDQHESDVEANSDDGQSLTVEADGYGLPEPVTMDSLVRAVQQSRTLYEVQTALELDRATTRDLLTDLDLLDLVTSRIAADRTTDLEDVIDRIHAANTA